MWQYSNDFDVDVDVDPGARQGAPLTLTVTLFSEQSIPDREFYTVTRAHQVLGFRIPRVGCKA